MPNGVDANHYTRTIEPDLAFSCVFWGRLDFDPNVDALEWFLERIWPVVVKRCPAATLALFGFNPRPRVRALAQRPGVDLHADLPDLRAEVSRRQVVVLPFVTGGGIKNKLLEAAALAMPIVCTPWALSGTKGEAAVRVCRSAFEWADALAQLWSSPGMRQELGTAARRWVALHHTWEAAARTAALGIQRTMSKISHIPSRSSDQTRGVEVKSHHHPLIADTPLGSVRSPL
jgi:glycosyltransferase involved in cell wall biosynthesis